MAMEFCRESSPIRMILPSMDQTSILERSGWLRYVLLRSWQSFRVKMLLDGNGTHCLSWVVLTMTSYSGTASIIYSSSIPQHHQKISLGQGAWPISFLVNGGHTHWIWAIFCLSNM